MIKKYMIEDDKLQLIIDKIELDKKLNYLFFWAGNNVIAHIPLRWYTLKYKYIIRDTVCFKIVNRHIGGEI